ncbi:hypothetical protein HanOQP8_Chr08g0269571 [Helianthus annuus]|nr:hypothetical protein HanOQP8_Chr08g0269571 [Helianthus annuus]
MLIGPDSMPIIIVSQTLASSMLLAYSTSSVAAAAAGASFDVRMSSNSIPTCFILGRFLPSKFKHLFASSPNLLI